MSKPSRVRVTGPRSSRMPPVSMRNWSSATPRPTLPGHGPAITAGGYPLNALLASRTRLEYALGYHIVTPILRVSRLPPTQRPPGAHNRVVRSATRLCGLLPINGEQAIESNVQDSPWRPLAVLVQGPVAPGRPHSVVATHHRWKTS